jgi:4-amino-4-deoxy-L-arabinose transferase-like glycosyltransferase
MVMLSRDVRFHNDEALYATYARAIALHGDYLIRTAPVPLDKPPLGLAITALGFTAFGVNEFGGRLPTVFVSAIALSLCYRLGRRLYNEGHAQVAMLLLALSPFELAFAATLFHDPLLTLWLLLVTWGCTTGRWRVVGVATALSLATKQSAVQFLPVFALVGMAAGGPTNWQGMRKLWLPLLVGVGLLALWSVARAAPVDFWTLGVVNPGQLRLIRADEVIPRLARWLDLLGVAVGQPPLLPLLLLPLIAVLVARRSRAGLVDSAIGVGVIGTLLLYWLLAYNLYDRYLVPLVPLVLLLLARAVRLIPRRARLNSIATALVVILMLPTLHQTLTTGVGIGGDQGANRDIRQLAAHLRSLPPEAIIHQFWLDWTLGFYAGDPFTVALPTLLFQPSPEALIRAVCGQPRGAHYLALPAALVPRWIAVLRAGKATIQPLLESSVGLYRVTCAQATSSEATLPPF